MSNVDPQELAKFGELAHRWWDRNSEFRPLHDMNPLRLEWIDGLAGLGGKRVLDIGCGGGILSESMAARAEQVVGIDLAGKALGVAARQVEANREALDLLQSALSDHLRAANDAHRDFLRKEDAHLSEVLGKLYGLVDEIVRATHAVHERGIGGAADARA